MSETSTMHSRCPRYPTCRDGSQQPEQYEHCQWCGGEWPCRAVLSERLKAVTAGVKDALDCLPRALDGSSPFSMSQRAEVMLAIESLRRALAAGQPAPAAAEGA